MTKPKKPEPNPIEEAIGKRANPKTEAEKLTEAMGETWGAVAEKVPQNPLEIPDEPSPQEMLSLEELNRQTEERFRDEPEMTTVAHTVPKVPIIPVSKPVPQPVTKTSSQESPPQEAFDSMMATRNIEAGHAPPTVLSLREMINKNSKLFPPAEDIELTALKKYILEDGFVLATVAFHIVTLCAEPMTTPSTTTWDFMDRASIPDMVLALLNQPGYLEGIWPSLKIVMGSNKGNSAWCAGIATTIAFFDTVRVLPALKELQNEKKS